MQVSVHLAGSSGTQPVEAESVPAGRDLRSIRKSLNAVGRTVPSTAALELGSQLLRKLRQLPDDFERPLELRPATLVLSHDGQVIFDPTGLRRNRGRRQDYAAPEVLMGHSGGAPAEVYAATVTVLELLSGHPPNRSPMLRAPHQQAVDEALAQGRQFLPTGAAGVFLNVFARGLAHDPTDRANPREMAALFDLLLVGLSGPSLNDFAEGVITPSP